MSPRPRPCLRCTGRACWRLFCLARTGPGLHIILEILEIINLILLLHHGQLGRGEGRSIFLRWSRRLDSGSGGSTSLPGRCWLDSLGLGARYSKVNQDFVNFNPILGVGHNTPFVDVLHHHLQNRDRSLREDEDWILLEKRNGPSQETVAEWQDDGLVDLNKF